MRLTAVGTVLAVRFPQPLPQRRMLLVYAVLLVVGSVLAAAAHNAHVHLRTRAAGLTTSMLLIAAAPPLTIGYPRDRLQQTAVIMNMCVFGAVALGPFIGGVAAAPQEWGPRFCVRPARPPLAFGLSAAFF